MLSSNGRIWHCSQEKALESPVYNDCLMNGREECTMGGLGKLTAAEISLVGGAHEPLGMVSQKGHAWAD